MVAFSLISDIVSDSIGRFKYEFCCFASVSFDLNIIWTVSIVLLTFCDYRTVVFNRLAKVYGIKTLVHSFSYKLSGALEFFILCHLHFFITVI